MELFQRLSPGVTPLAQEFLKGPMYLNMDNAWDAILGNVIRRPQYLSISC